MNSMKGQAAVEYLLLLGGVVLVAAIVVALISGLAPSSGFEAAKTAANSICIRHSSSTICDPAIENFTIDGFYFECSWDATERKCESEFVGGLVLSDNFTRGPREYRFYADSYPGGIGNPNIQDLRIAITGSNASNALDNYWAKFNDAICWQINDYLTETSTDGWLETQGREDLLTATGTLKIYRPDSFSTKADCEP